jgi:hypothetical protein
MQNALTGMWEAWSHNPHSFQEIQEKEKNYMRYQTYKNILCTHKADIRPVEDVQHILLSLALKIAQLLVSYFFIANFGIDSFLKWDPREIPYDHMVFLWFALVLFSRHLDNC